MHHRFFYFVLQRRQGVLARKCIIRFCLRRRSNNSCTRFTAPWDVFATRHVPIRWADLRIWLSVTESVLEHRRLRFSDPALHVFVCVVHPFATPGPTRFRHLFPVHSASNCHDCQRRSGCCKYTLVEVHTLKRTVYEHANSCCKPSF